MNDVNQAKYLSEDEFYTRIGFLKISKNKKIILRYLINDPKTAVELSNELNIYISSVYKSIKELLNIGAIYQVNAPMTKNKKYLATDLGINLMMIVDKDVEGLDG